MMVGSTNEKKNVYYYCRKKAGESDVRFKSRDGAAELLGISAVSLRDHETGGTKVIPPDVVARMSILYNAPELRSHYCAECPIGEVQKVQKPGEEVFELEKLTLRLLSSFKDITGVKDKLIEIAADGVIDEFEKPDLEYVLKTLDTVALHVQELKIWAEREFGRLGQ